MVLVYFGSFCASSLVSTHSLWDTHLIFCCVQTHFYLPFFHRTSTRLVVGLIVYRVGIFHNFVNTTDKCVNLQLGSLFLELWIKRGRPESLLQLFGWHH